MSVRRKTAGISGQFDNQCTRRESGKHFSVQNGRRNGVEKKAGLWKNAAFRENAQRDRFRSQNRQLIPLPFRPGGDENLCAVSSEQPGQTFGDPSAAGDEDARSAKGDRKKVDGQKKSAFGGRIRIFQGKDFIGKIIGKGNPFFGQKRFKRTSGRGKAAEYRFSGAGKALQDQVPLPGAEEPVSSLRRGSMESGAAEDPVRPDIPKGFGWEEGRFSPKALVHRKKR